MRVLVKIKLLLIHKIHGEYNVKYYRRHFTEISFITFLVQFLWFSVLIRENLLFYFITILYWVLYTIFLYLEVWVILSLTYEFVGFGSCSMLLILKTVVHLKTKAVCCWNVVFVHSVTIVKVQIDISDILQNKRCLEKFDFEKSFEIFTSRLIRICESDRYRAKWQISGKVTDIWQDSVGNR